MSDFKWYIVRSYANFENKVADAIMERARAEDLEDHFAQIEVPAQDEIEASRGVRRTVSRRFFPGYVLVRMKLTSSTYHLIKKTPKVSGFLGADGGKKPLPATEVEIDRVLGRARDTVERSRPLITFELGEHIKINDGPFQSFEGAVQEVDEEAGRLKVNVTIFGRETPVELQYEQVEKL